MPGLMSGPYTHESKSTNADWSNDVFEATISIIDLKLSELEQRLLYAMIKL